MATRGRQILVKVGRLGGEVIEYALNGNPTIEKALDAAGIELDEDQVARVNGTAVEDLSEDLKNGDIVTVAGQVKGAC